MSSRRDSRHPAVGTSIDVDVDDLADADEWWVKGPQSRIGVPTGLFESPSLPVIDLTTAPLTSEALRGQVEGVVVPFGLSVDEFVASDVDDLPSDELRDVWLMVKGALAPESGVASRS